MEEYVSSCSNMQVLPETEERAVFPGGSAKPTARAFFTNMSMPMPLHKKLSLVIRNQFIVRYGPKLLPLLPNQGARYTPAPAVNCFMARGSKLGDTLAICT
jgi:hypothetical protein